MARKTEESNKEKDKIQQVNPVTQRILTEEGWKRMQMKKRAQRQQKSKS